MTNLQKLKNFFAEVENNYLLKFLLKLIFAEVKKILDQGKKIALLKLKLFS